MNLGTFLTSEEERVFQAEVIPMNKMLKKKERKKGQSLKEDFVDQLLAMDIV